MSSEVVSPYAQMSFGDFYPEAARWITLATGEYYPDILEPACRIYQPVIEQFGHLLRQSASSEDLLKQISEVSVSWMRIQLLRIFRRYVSPRTPVEMLKRKRKIQAICEEFGPYFRPIHEVQAAFDARPSPDEALCALLWEYRERGKKGYDLTEKFFTLFAKQFPDLTIEGPRRAGRDIRLGDVFPGYPNPDRPVDFVIYGPNGKVLAIGLARYDSDRGGAQEDDRPGGYASCADEFFTFADRSEEYHRVKMIFVNDGPGLLLGSMWQDYAALERRWPSRIRVVTLRMVPYRLTREWLQGG